MDKPLSAPPARAEYHGLSEGRGKRGHFYFAGKRTLLFCPDTGSLRALCGLDTESTPKYTHCELVELSAGAYDAVTIDFDLCAVPSVHHVRPERSRHHYRSSCRSGWSRGFQRPGRGQKCWYWSRIPGGGDGYGQLYDFPASGRYLRGVGL